MPTTRKLTFTQLKAKGACADQLALFELTFGNSVIVDVELCQRVASQFDFDWAARNLLSAPASAEYERVTAPASAEYERVTAPALAEYERVRATAFAIAF